MKRFINLGHQMNDDKSERPQFAFYCTISGKFEKFNGSSAWDSVEDFTEDYKFGRVDYQFLNRYTSKIPESFGKDYDPMRSLVDAFNRVFGDESIQANLDEINAWAEKYNTERESDNWSESGYIIPVAETIRELKEQ